MHEDSDINHKIMTQQQTARQPYIMVLPVQIVPPFET